MLVRLVNTPNKDWDSKRRVWTNRDGWLGEVVKEGGKEPYRWVVVRLFRSHRKTGRPLKLKEEHLKPEQLEPAVNLTADEQRLVDEYRPLIEEDARRKDRDITGRVLWLRSYEGETMGQMAHSLLVDKVRDELVEEATRPADKLAVARYFQANSALLVLIVARLSREIDAQRDRKTSENSTSDLSFVDSLGRPISLNDESDWLDEHLSDRPWFEGPDDIALLRSLADEFWSEESHFEGNRVRPKWRDLYDRAPEANPGRDLLVAQTALLVCPDRRLVARLPPELVEWLARSAGHFMYCRDIAGWDYSSALRLALYDVLQLLWEERFVWDKSVQGDGPPFVALRTLEGLLLARPRTCLRGGPLAVWFLTLLVKRLLPGMLPGAAVSYDVVVKVAGFLASRASANPKNQLFLGLPSAGPDTAGTALEAAINVLAPSVTESFPAWLVDLVRHGWEDEGDSEDEA